jgi:hypothetical protein
MAVNATAVWRVRPAGSNTNGGGFDSGIAGAGTDYSQQNAAQASGTHGTASGTTAFSDTTAANFTSAMVGNALSLSGSGFTTGWYFVTGYTDASHVTLDRSPGTGTAGTWALGGGWADFWTNPLSAGNPVVAGNTVYILGTGMPSVTAGTYSYGPDYTFTGSSINVSGNATAGTVNWVGDPSTPGGGMPLVKYIGSGAWYNPSYSSVQGIWFIAGSSNVTIFGNNAVVAFNVFDQAGYDASLATVVGHVIGNKIFTSVNGSSHNNYAINLTIAYGSSAKYNHIYNCIGGGIQLSGNVIACIERNLITGNYGKGIYVASSNNTNLATIEGNTLDANGGGGLYVANQTTLGNLQIFNNIFSNHTTAGTYAFSVGGGTAAPNNRVSPMHDYNTFYNNASDLSAIGYGAHDSSNTGAAPVTNTANPYNNQPGGDYTLTSSYVSTGFPQTAF